MRIRIDGISKGQLNLTSIKESLNMIRILLILIILSHGFIHLIGFAKAFQLSEIKQITQHISKPMGLIWLTAFLAFTLTAILFIGKNKYWWLAGILSVSISQFIIIYFWHDARYGTIANLIILAASLAGLGNLKYYQQYTADVEKAFEQETDSSISILTESDIATLPDPVKDYIRYTGSIGKPKVINFKVESEGQIRKNEQSEWMPFTTEQYNFISKPYRLYYMNAKMMNLPVAGYHSYKDGKAVMDIRLFSVFKVQYKEGAEMDKAETVTFFNDMCCMAPASLIDKRINWLKTEGRKVLASFTHNNTTIHAWLFFNENSELVNFISEDRYDYDAGKNLPWSTPMKDYTYINGYRLPAYADAIYSYPEKDLCYGKFKITNVVYNLKSLQQAPQ
ncbi:MAG: hypothetical protein EYC69_09280 [Bacteroidetes bacterium]|nr:MAG: hypothetical protein EYC69_09280 [Bacteroidota bacterium]